MKLRTIISTISHWISSGGRPDSQNVVHTVQANWFGTSHIMQPHANWSDSTSGYPNPALEYCEEKGGKLELRLGPSGGVTGMCVFVDGSQCEEWAYFRGEYNPEGFPVKPIVSGIPSPLSPNVTVPPALGAAGKIVFYSNRDSGYNNIYLLEIGSSNLTHLTQGEANFFSGPFSPEGTQLLFTGFGLTHNYVGVMNVDGNEQSNLTNLPDTDGFPAWSPDGQHIALTSRRDGNTQFQRGR